MKKGKSVYGLIGDGLTGASWVSDERPTVEEIYALLASDRITGYHGNSPSILPILTEGR